MTITWYSNVNWMSVNYTFNNNYVTSISVHLTKAFDTVDHDMALHKLDSYGNRGHANKILLRRKHQEIPSSRICLGDTIVRMHHYGMKPIPLRHHITSRIVIESNSKNVLYIQKYSGLQHLFLKVFHKLWNVPVPNLDHSQLTLSWL